MPMPEAGHEAFITANYSIPMMSNLLRLSLAVLLGLSAQAVAYGQLNVIQGATPAQLVQNVLVGNGVSVSNVTFVGDPLQIAEFQNAGFGVNNLPLQSGIVMCSGGADVSQTTAMSGGQFNIDGGSSSLLNFPAGGDADLSAIVNGAVTNDAAVLEFDFVPLSDTIRFRYIFASEEYPEYVCSNFNDVFAFLLSGPGIPGIQNIALIPGTPLAVAINNVNPGVVGGNGQLANCTPPNGSLAFSQYYIDNLNGLDVEFDGFTVVLEAVAGVIPCSTYHIKIAIADVFDSAFDSGVFLEAQSFTADVLDISVQSLNADSTAVEGCVNTDITFTLNSPALNAYTVPILIFGTAQIGIDYTAIPNSVTIAAGDTSATISINPIVDGLFEGIETVRIGVQTSPCSYDTVTAYIREEVILPITTPSCNFANETTLTFCWPPSAGATGYLVSIDQGATWIPPAPGPLCHTVTGLVPNTDVTLWVQPQGGYEACNENPIDSVTCTTLCLLQLPPIPDVQLCPGDTAILNATIPVGSPTTSFVNATPTQIPVPLAGQPANTVQIPLAVAGIPYTNIQPNSIVSLCLNINQSFVGDIQLQLVSPNGTVVNLSMNNGIFFNNYTNTCFVPTGAPNITTGAAPYTGNWLPQAGSFNAMNGGPINGTWFLVINHTGNQAFGGQNGTFLNATLVLNNLNTVNYTWSPAATLSCANCPAPQAFPNGPTTYQVIATDIFNCADTALVDVTLGNTLSAPIPVCDSSTNNSVTFGWAAIPGAASYTITIDGGAPINVGNVLTFTVNGLAVGQTVTITVIANAPAGGGCGNSPIGTIACTAGGCNPLPVNINPNTASFCPGGSATLTATAGYTTYTWTTPSGNPLLGQAITANEAGTYTLTVTDANGCTGTASATTTINANLSPQITGLLQFCTGNSTTLDAGAGYATYLWSPGGQNTQTITVNAGGTYIVSVTDAGGCAGSDTVTVTQNNSLTPVILGDSSICAGTSTLLDAGAGYASYNWTLPGGGNANSQTINATLAGAYTVVVSDANGCTGTVTEALTVTNNPAPVINGLTQICNNSTATLDAGAGFVTYAWTGGSTGQTLTVNTAGTYGVTVTDANGCSGTDTVTVTVVAALSPVINGDVDLCAGETTLLDVGAGYATYTWSVPGQTGQTLSVNASGIYSVTVSNAAGCTGTASATVTVSANPAPTITPSGPTTFCSGGTVDLQATGGFASYLWGGGEVTPTITATLSGVYSVTVTDANGCTGTVSQTVTVNPNPVANITGNLTICSGVATTLDAGAGFAGYAWSVGGNGQTITVTSGGVVGLTVTDANGCTASTGAAVIENLNPTPTVTGDFTICTGESTVLDAGAGAGWTYAWTPAGNSQTITATVGGTYTVTVTDGNGCTGTSSATVVENANPAPNITGVLSICSGQSTVLDAGAGAGWTYAWTPGGNTQAITVIAGGTYSVTITDANGCTGTDSEVVTENLNPTPVVTGDFSICTGEVTSLDAGTGAGWSYTWLPTGDTTQILNATAGGTYDVTVTDGNGCTGTATATVVENANPAPAVVGDLAICTGEVTTLDAGAGAGWNYAWSPTGEITQTINVTSGGTYAVTITDANGCTGTSGVTVVENANPTPNIVASGDTVFCFGGSVVLSVNGVSGVTYSWSTPLGGSLAPTVTAGESGTFSVTVTDAAGCVGADNILITELPELTTTVTTTDVLCFGGSDGSATANPVGGSGNYTYSWNTTPPAGGQTINGLSIGVYTVVVSDAAGCTATASGVVGQPFSPVQVSVVVSDATCFGLPNGIALANATGGVGNYSYAWSNGANTVQADGLAAGTYSVTVTDGNGCAASDTAIITEPTPIILLGNDIDASCYGAADGQASIAASGGIFAAYTYVWDNGQTTASIGGLLSGTYTVTVTDNNGCTISESIFVGQPDSLYLNVVSINGIGCNGAATGSAEVIALGGRPSYSYLWSTGATTPDISQQPEGDYSVTVTDFNGCTASLDLTIGQAGPLSMTLTQVAGIVCFGDSTGALVAEATGGTPDYSYSWSHDTLNLLPFAGGLAAGTYTVTVSDANGCQDTASLSISEPATAVSFSLVEPTDATCFGYADGTIQVEGQGGTYPYLFSIDGGTTWQGNDLFDGLAMGDYTLTIQDYYGCRDSAQASVDEPVPFVVVAEQDTTIELGYSTNLNAATNANPLTDTVLYVWTPVSALSCTDCTDPIANPIETTIYVVEATNSVGCVSMDTVTVTVDRVRRVFVATLFTPNGDGVNDVLLVQGGAGTDRVELFRIYDRWGELVFETVDAPLNDLGFGWDGSFKGKPLNPGVFTWYGEVRYADGYIESLKGETALMR